MLGTDFFTLTSTPTPRPSLFFRRRCSPARENVSLAPSPQAGLIGGAVQAKRKLKLLHALFLLSVLFRPVPYQHMSSLDIPPAPRLGPSEGTSPHSSSSRSRTVHSRQMSSLSMNTLATTSQSHQPSDSLLHRGERTGQPSGNPPRPEPSYVGCRPRFPLVV